MGPADPIPRPPSRCILIGLGNPLLSDDAVGPAVARRVRDLLESPDVELQELPVGGVELMERVLGYGKAVVVDAIITGKAAPGTCHLLDLERSTAGTRASGHEIGLLEGLALGRQLGLAVPDFVRVYAVEVLDPFTFGTKMSKQVERAVPRVAREIASEVRRHLCG